jgi:hypothetical protein
MMASCSTVTTVDLGTVGPVKRSNVDKLLSFGGSLWVDAMTPGQRLHALLTMLSRSTDRLYRCGAQVKNFVP